AHHAAVLQELRQDVFGHVDRDGEAEPLGRPDDGRVDADHLTAAVHQRTAGIARVEGGIGLDDVIDEMAGYAAQRPAEGADHAGRDGGIETEWTADGDDELADADLAGVAED